MAVAKQIPCANGMIAVRASQRCRGKLVPADADHRDVGVGVVADEVRIEARAVGEAHLDRARAVHHMAVGEDEAVGRKHESRAAAAARRFALGRAGGLGDLDVNDGGADALRGRDHRSGIGIEQGGVAFGARRGSRARRTVIECRNRIHDPAGRGGALRKIKDIRVDCWSSFRSSAANRRGSGCTGGAASPGAS